MPLIWSIDGVRRPDLDDYSHEEKFAEFEVRLREQIDKLKVQGGAKQSSPAAKAYSAQQNPPHPQRHPALLVRDVMTRSVVSVGPETAVNEAGRTMKERRFRHLPVVGVDRKILGMLSDRDIFPHVGVDEYRPVSEVMARKVLTATADTEIRMAAGVMLAERIHSLPVVKADGTLQGIFTTSDILKALWRHAPLELWA
jgi:CBS domain-containing protein